MVAQKILVIEDSADIREALQEGFNEEGYSTSAVADGDEALRVFYEFQPDLVLLDVLLPGTTGFDLRERIRSMSNVPVIILSGLADEREKIRAFEKGADDYVVKGTGMGEILARVAAGLRRASSPNGPTPVDKYSDDALEIDFARRTVSVRGEATDLTPTEYKLLSMLVRQKGQPVPAEQLLHSVWGREYDTEELVKWHVGHLRRKVETDPASPQLIITRRGFGYVYIEQRSAAAAA
jgi:DNA-binding response OmpR family regulator